MAAQYKMNALAFALLIKFLGERPRTLHTLAELTGLCTDTLRAYVRALHAQKQVHIVRWDKDGMGRDTTPYYSLGFGIDVPRAAKSSALKMRERREKAREDAWRGLVTIPLGRVNSSESMP